MDSLGIQPRMADMPVTGNWEVVFNPKVTMSPPTQRRKSRDMPEKAGDPSWRRCYAAPRGRFGREVMGQQFIGGNPS